MLKKKITKTSTTKFCGNCGRMDVVGKDDPCPKIRPCILYVKSGQELKYWIPKS